MGKVNLIIASRWLLSQKITSSCTRKFQVVSVPNPTSFPAFRVKILARGFHEVCGGISSTQNIRKASFSLKEELEDILNLEDVRQESGTSSMICIYKVPITMRQVKREAYEPNIVSIGPYHHGQESLQEMERLKRIYFRRLFQPNYLLQEGDQLEDDAVSMKKNAVLDEAMNAMQKLEGAARRCYSEESTLSSKDFVKMMMIDGSFIIGLLRDSLLQPNFEHTPSVIQRWMLPTLRQDLIKLENQLPLFVLRKLFQLIITESTTCDEQQIAHCLELESLAIRFFNPLLEGHAILNKPLQHFAPKHLQGGGSSSSSRRKHFLDLLHEQISPNLTTYPEMQAPPRGKQTRRIISIQQLKEAGVKFVTDTKRGPLDITVSRGAFGLGRVVTIPPINIDDHKGTLFRNMVAFEKCYPDCHQDVTTYLFFLDSLINSAKDVGLLHYHEVLHHSLGSNKSVAELVNNLCKEVGPDVFQSYLYRVIGDVNEYYTSYYGRIRGFLVHHHFNSWLVGISTLAAFIALYLQFIQTGCTVTETLQKSDDTTIGAILKGSLFLKHIFTDSWGSVKKFLHRLIRPSFKADLNDMKWFPYNLI